MYAVWCVCCRLVGWDSLCSAQLVQVKHHALNPLCAHLPEHVCFRVSTVAESVVCLHSMVYSVPDIGISHVIH